MKFSVYQQVILSRNVAVEAASEAEAKAAAAFELEEDGSFFAVNGEGWEAVDRSEIVDAL